MNSKDQADAPPRKVLLFSGHMIDAPDRKEPRFPASRGARRGERDRPAACFLLISPPIRATLRSAAAPAAEDLLFAEACLAGGAALELYRCRLIEKLLSHSIQLILPAPNWRRRFFAVKSKGTLLGHRTRRAWSAPDQRRSV